MKSFVLGAGWEVFGKVFEEVGLGSCLGLLLRICWGWWLKNVFCRCLIIFGKGEGFREGFGKGVE